MLWWSCVGRSEDRAVRNPTPQRARHLAPPGQEPGGAWRVACGHGQNSVAGVASDLNELVCVVAVADR